MFNFNFLIKKLNKILISINGLIESFFIKISKLLKVKKNKKPRLKEIDKKITIIVSLFVFLFLSYFLLPTFFNKNETKSLLEKQIFEKYNLKVSFNDSFKYGLFPKPHFFSNDLTVNYKKKNIIISNYSRIFISPKNFLTPTLLEVKDLYFKKNELNFNSNTIKFFQDILNYNKSKSSIIFNNSKLFYKNIDDDVISILKIDNLKFSYNQDKKNHKLISSYKIFNVPFKLEVINYLKEKKLLINFKSKKIRLNLENEIFFNQNRIDGLLKALILNKEQIFDYKIDTNSLSFSSSDYDFNGKIDFKPFYFLSNLNFDQLDLKKLFKDDSIFINLINSEIFYNQNLNATSNINFNKIKGIQYLNKIKLKTYLEEGNIYIKDSSLNWNNSILINLENIQLINEKNNITFLGEVKFDFKDLQKFFSYYQVKKDLRNEIEEIKLDFIFNLNQKKISLDNVKVDNKSNKKINSFINQFNSQNKNILNKLTFRKFINNFLTNYEG